MRGRVDDIDPKSKKMRDFFNTRFDGACHAEARLDGAVAYERVTCHASKIAEVAEYFDAHHEHFLRPEGVAAQPRLAAAMWAFAIGSTLVGSDFDGSKVESVVVEAGAGVNRDPGMRYHVDRAFYQRADWHHANPLRLFGMILGAGDMTPSPGLLQLARKNWQATLAASRGQQRTGEVHPVKPASSP